MTFLEAPENVFVSGWVEMPTPVNMIAETAK